jgi:hypothetical protein
MKIGDSGTTSDGTPKQTQEIMPDTPGSVVPKPVAAVQTALNHRVPSELTEERKREIEAESKRKIQFMEREYWKLRNGEQEYMRCPFCAIPSTSDGREREFRINIMDQPLCCPLFAKAFAAILDRQAQVDTAAQMVRNCAKVGLVN